MTPYMDAPFTSLGNKIGVGGDELKLVFSFLLSYPLAGLLKRIPDSKPGWKNVYNISVSLFYLVGLFNLWVGLRTMLVSSLGAYAIAKYFRASPYMPWLAFVFLMGHMSANHIVRQGLDTPQKVDITGAQMVLVMKMSAFCWNVADGTLPIDQLSDLRKDRRLTELPSLLDFAGYVFFFPSLMAGPAFDFVEYSRWLDLSMFQALKTLDPAKKPATRKKRKIPRSGTPATIKLLTGLGWIALFVKMSAHFHPDTLLGPRFARYPFLLRVLILHLVGVTARLKYYGVWTLTEGACILAGLGYNGIDPRTGSVSWDRLQNIKPLEVELAQNTRAFLGFWNINTNNWLRNYVYLRVTPRGKKPGFRATLATFTTSAFWHGFYPGYYMTFVLASLLQTVAKNFRRLLRPFFLDPKTQTALPSKRFYDLFTWLITQAAFAFTVAPFLVLGFRDAWTVWARMYFYTLVGTAVSLILFASPAKVHLKKSLERRAARAGVTRADADGKTRDHDPRRASSTDSVTPTTPVMGLSQDPGRVLDEALSELKAEVRMRKAKVRGAASVG